MEGLAPEEFEPKTPDELQWCLSNPMWRINNLYYIKIKDDDDVENSEGNLIAKFKMNAAQRKLAENLWYRNIIPKARQLGITTFASILALDSALFQPNFHAGIIAHTERDARKIFRNKVKFAYDRLPESIRELYPTTKCTEEEIVFSNGSSILCAVSMRSDTLHFLHVSEFGKICAKFPERAKEVITGSIPAVPLKGIVMIESTAEGDTGSFYKMTMRAKEHADSNRKLNTKQYRLHFYPWYDGPEYRMDPRTVQVNDADHEYFDTLEAELGIELNSWQRAWYVATREEDFAGQEEDMWQEYPSTVEEAFKKSSEGCYYTKQLATARKEKRIKEFPIMDHHPCLTFWDIGSGDGTAIWVMQIIDRWVYVIDFFEMWDEPYSTATAWLQNKGYQYEEHFLPHDADHVRQGKDVNESPLEMVEQLMPGQKFTVLDRIQDLSWGIQQTRDSFKLLVFHETNCKPGIDHVKAYTKKWNQQQGRFIDVPEKNDGNSEAADALRQFGQAYTSGRINHALPDVRNKRNKEEYDYFKTRGSRSGGSWRVA